MSAKMEAVPLILSPKQARDFIIRRFLSFIGWDGQKIDGQERWRTRPLAFIGHAGIGKSEVPLQAAVELAKLIGENVRVVTTNLQFCELPDFMGLPFNELVNGSWVTRHGVPRILPTGDEFTIWFIDEPNRAGRDIRSGLLTLLQARQVNGVSIGKNTMIVMAMNPNEADGVQYEVSSWDAALQDRIAPVQFKASLDDLVDFLTEKYGRNDPVVKWIRLQGDQFVNLNGDGRATPRSLEFLIRSIRAEGGIKSKNFWDAAAAEVGQALATTFKKFLDESIFVKPEDVVYRYNDEIRDTIEFFAENGRVDVLNTLTDGLAEIIYNKMVELAEKWPSEEQPVWSKYPEFHQFMLNIGRYLDDSDADSGHSFLMAVCDRFPEKDKYIAMARWLKAHAPKFLEHYKKIKAGLAKMPERATAVPEEKSEAQG